jgi:hypothetical protein
MQTVRRQAHRPTNGAFLVAGEAVLIVMNGDGRNFVLVLPPS